jgi:hypothetical protein
MKEEKNIIEKTFSYTMKVLALLKGNTFLETVHFGCRKSSSKIQKCLLLSDKTLPKKLKL